MSYSITYLQRILPCMIRNVERVNEPWTGGTRWQITVHDVVNRVITFDRDLPTEISDFGAAVNKRWQVQGDTAGDNCQITAINVALRQISYITLRGALAVGSNVTFWNPFRTFTMNPFSYVIGTNAWATTYISPGGVWLHSDGQYRMIVNGWDASHGMTGLYKSPDLLTWTDCTGAFYYHANVHPFDEAWCVGAATHWTSGSPVKIPGTANYAKAFQGLNAAGRGEVGIVIFDEDFAIVTMPVAGITVPGYVLDADHHYIPGGMAYLDGVLYLTIRYRNTTTLVDKILIMQLDAPATYICSNVEEVCTNTTDTYYELTAQNPCPFVYNNTMYVWVAGENSTADAPIGDTNEMYGLFYKAGTSWLPYAQNPVICNPMYGENVYSGCDWAIDHMGTSLSFIQVGNILHLFVSMCMAANTYKIAKMEMDLNVKCDWTFYVTYDGDTTQIYPLNWNEFTLTDTKFGDEVFYRRNFKGELIFGGRGSHADYDLFRDIELAGDQCDELPFYIYKDGLLYWTGYFSTSQGAWDYDECTFTVTPLIDDVYRKFLDKYDIEIDLLDPAQPVIAIWCTDGITSYHYIHNYLVKELLDYLLTLCVPALTLHSDFLTAATNPITKTTNRYIDLMIGPKKSFKTLALTTTPLMISLKGLLEMLKCLNLRWELIGTVLTVEHVSEWTGHAGIDIRTIEMAFSTNKYKYVNEEMPKYEKFSWMEAGYTDFIGYPIWYDSTCVNQDSKTNILETSYEITTDLEYIQEAMLDEETYSQISDSGWVITANENRGGTYYVWWNDAFFSIETLYPNADMSWAWLHNNFFKDDRQLKTGNMNDTPNTPFYTSKKIKEQICSILYGQELDPEEYITTELGFTYFADEKGFVQSAKMHPYGQIDLILRYGPEHTDNPGVIYDEIVYMWEVCDTDLDQSTFYAMLNMVSAADVDIVFTITVQDVGTNECTSGNQTLTITAGSYYGFVVVAWPNGCGAPWVGPPICVSSVTEISTTLPYELYGPPIDYDCPCS